MKKLLSLFAAIAILFTGMAQGKSDNKGKNKMKNKDYKEKKVKDKDKDDDDDNNGIWGGTQNSKSGKISKNQPKKVVAAFVRDYPNAANVRWSKYRGDYTATFTSGLGWGTSTAVYHANGDRRDTRTSIKRSQLPNGSIWDKIFKRDNVNPVSFIQIQSPTLATEIFRIASQLTGSSIRYLFYDANGQPVQYNY